MDYTIDNSSRTPAYLQLYEALLKDIISGVYRPGDKLPSKRVLMDRSGVSAVTAEHTYSLLCDEGYVLPRERSGYYVIYGSGESPAFSGLPENFRSGSAGAGLRPMKSEDLPGSDFPFSIWSRTVRQVLSGYGTEVLKRAPGKGAIELREALSVYLARNRGIQADADCIIIGSGSENLYGRLVVLLGRKKIYGVENPSYAKIAAVYGANDVQYELLELGRDGITSGALSATRAEVLHVTPYRSFPSGATATAEKRREYLSWVNSRPGRYIVEDDVESEFTLLSKPVNPLFSSGTGANVIYMNSFSVTLSPSLRIAYMILPRELLETYETRLGFCACPVPTLDQLVLAEFIRSGEFERHVNRIRRQIRKAQMPLPGEQNS